MANTPDMASCFAPAEKREELLPLSPFYALSYHFGMLLGVDDFETEQAYHRAKMRLHNAWLHRDGVVWGFDVRLDKERSEIRVLPGLALDAAGHELHLEADACLGLDAWYNTNTDNPEFTFTRNDNTVRFDAHVVIRFKACLTRQVPALLEPCDGMGGDTAYSRVFETIEILLRPDLAPVQEQLPYHHLRLLFGLDKPRMENGAVVAGDQAVLDVLDNIRALARKDQPEALLQAFHRLAARDVITLKPAMSSDGNRTLLFPGRDDDPVVLANLSGITLEHQGEHWVLTGGEVETAARPSHIATSALQELLCSALLWGKSAAADAGGPRAEANSVVVDEPNQEISFVVDSDLHPASVTANAFAVTFFDNTGWHDIPIDSPNFDAGTKRVTLALQNALAGERVRLIARGTGTTPLLGDNLVPLAGTTSDPPATKHNGRDFVFMHERS